MLDNSKCTREGKSNPLKHVGGGELGENVEVLWCHDLVGKALLDEYSTYGFLVLGGFRGKAADGFGHFLGAELHLNGLAVLGGEDLGRAAREQLAGQLCPETLHLVGLPVNEDHGWWTELLQECACLGEIRVGGE